jgi:hypothetical protein
MSANEMIRQVAALPPQERTLFKQLLREMEIGGGTPGQASRSRWPDFSQRLHDIYGDKIAPDSQNIIDEGRGDRRWTPISTQRLS